MKITDEEIERCTDPEELRDMLDECEEAIEDMELQIATRRRLDTAKPDWLDRVSSAVCHTERVARKLREKLG